MKVKMKRCYKDKFIHEMEILKKYHSTKTRLNVVKTFINRNVVDGTSDGYVLFIQDEAFYLSWFIKVGD